MGCEDPSLFSFSSFGIFTRSAILSPWPRGKGSWKGGRRGVEREREKEKERVCRRGRCEARKAGDDRETLPVKRERGEVGRERTRTAVVSGPSLTEKKETEMEGGDWGRERCQRFSKINPNTEKHEFA